MFDFTFNPVLLWPLPADLQAVQSVAAHGGPSQSDADSEALERRAEFIVAGTLF